MAAVAMVVNKAEAAVMENLADMDPEDSRLLPLVWTKQVQPSWFRSSLSIQIRMLRVVLVMILQILRLL